MTIRPIRTIASALAIATMALTAAVLTAGSAGAITAPTVKVPGPSITANASDILFGESSTMACSPTNDRAMVIADWFIASPQNNRSTVMTITVKADPAPGTLVGRSQVVTIRSPLAAQAHEQIALPCANWDSATITWKATGLDGSTRQISESFRFQNIDSLLNGF